MWVMHRFAVKLGAMFRRTRAPGGHGPMITLAIVKMMIDVAIEIGRTVIPGPGADEYPAREPLRSVITIRRAVVRGYLVIPVRTNRRLSYADGNLCCRIVHTNRKKAGSKNGQNPEVSKCFH